MKKKYEFTGETKEIITNDTRLVILHRIRALIDFGNIKKGDLGDWIEKESNLSQKGNCWVGDEAQVYENARVCIDAEVHNNAEIFGEARISDYARIYNHVNIFGRGIIKGNMKLR